MKRYLVFAYASYYPEGGMNDWQGDFDSIREARLFMLKIIRDWDIVEGFDRESGERFDIVE